MIALEFHFVDSARVQTKRYKTLAGAQKAAHYQIGAHPSMCRYYAVDDYGCCTIHVDGCTLDELFPAA